MKAAVLLTLALFCLGSILAGELPAKVKPQDRGSCGYYAVKLYSAGSVDDMPEVPYCYFTPTPVFDQVGKPVVFHPRTTPDDQPVNPWRFILPEQQLK